MSARASSDAPMQVVGIVRIVAVDDHQEILDSLSRLLSGRSLNDGRSVEFHGVATVDDCIELMSVKGGDIVLVDLELDPDSRSVAKGRDLINRLSTDFDCGVVVYSNRPAETDSVDSLNIGADDYIHKPSSPDIMVSRIDALWRRVSRTRSFLGHAAALRQGEFQLGSWTFSIHSRTITRQDQALVLTLSEFEVLKALVSSPARSITREVFATFVLGRDEEQDGRRLDNLVYRLRQKLGPSVNIRNVRGQGYVITPVLAGN